RARRVRLARCSPPPTGGRPPSARASPRRRSVNESSVTTLHGFSGHLVAGSFLAGQLSVDPVTDAVRRALVSSHGGSLRRLGPATAPRALLESGLQPPLGGVRYGAPAGGDRHGPGGAGG